jgi:hypothetical protein
MLLAERSHAVRSTALAEDEELSLLVDVADELLDADAGLVPPP